MNKEQQKHEYYVVRIKEGSVISHDRGFGMWPQCKPPKSEGMIDDITKYPDALFIAKWCKDEYWDCIREGYGAGTSSSVIQGEYGNGSIFVYDRDSVEVVGKNLSMVQDNE